MLLSVLIDALWAMYLIMALQMPGEKAKLLEELIIPYSYSKRNRVKA